MRSTILVVDDSPMIIHHVSSILEDYHLKFALSGEDAIRCMEQTPNIDLVLLDIEMPGIDGYETIRRIKEQTAWKGIPVIFLTVKDSVSDETKGFELGAVDYIKKPINPTTLHARVKTHLSLCSANIFLTHQNEILENKVKQRTKEIIVTRDTTVQSLMALLEIRDIESGFHIKRTQLYIKLLCKELAMTGPYRPILTGDLVENIFKTSPLHDIGKIGIPDSILLKPGPLTEDEFETMKKHTLYGISAFSDASLTLGDNSFLGVAKDIAGAHHEKWDGSGYPYGLKGNDIPLPGRIMAIIDVYDALMSRRVYKEAYTHQQTLEIIKSSEESHFDPYVLDAFLRLKDAFRHIHENNYKENILIM